MRHDLRLLTALVSLMVLTGTATPSVAGTPAVSQNRAAIVASIQRLADRDAKRDRYQPDIAVLAYETNRGGLSRGDIVNIYEAEYDRVHRTPWPERLKGAGWLVALALFVALIFRDAVKTALTQTLTRSGEQIYRRVATNKRVRRRALRKYRRGLLDDASRIDVPFRPNRPLSLHQIYVSPNVRGRGDATSVGAWEAIEQHQRVVITGPPGSGKSMLLRHLASTYAAPGARAVTQHAVPVLIQLYRLRSGAEASPETQIAGKFQAYGFPRAERYVDTALVRGELLLLFDGFDEVPSAQKGAVAAELTQFLDRFRSCPAVITCRSAVYRGEFDALTSQVLELDPFADHQVEAFLGAWAESMPAGKTPRQLMAALRSQPRLLTAARNPLLLTIVAHLYADHPNYMLPRSRADFYRQATAIVLDQWQGHLDQNRFDSGEKSHVLRRIALEMQRKAGAATDDRATLSREQTLMTVMEVMPILGREASDATAVVREIVDRSGLLLSLDGGTRFSFAHLTFQEYFAAETLLDDSEDLLQHFADDSDLWGEVVKLWCGLAMDGSGVIRRVHRLDPTTALECVAEARALDEDIASSVLKPALDKVLEGGADETTQRGLAAVASDVRPRGEKVLEALIDALPSSANEARISICATLARTNRSEAARALVAELPRDSIPQLPLLLLGDLAVNPLADAARRGNFEAVRLLADIGTVDATTQLTELMLEPRGAARVPAAWAIVSLAGKQGVWHDVEINPEVRRRLGLPALESQMTRGTGSSETDDSAFSNLMSSAFRIALNTADPTAAVVSLDRRAIMAICASETEFLDCPLADSPPSSRLIEAANTVAGARAFHYLNDGTLIYMLRPSGSSPSSFGRGLASDRSVRRITAYRDLLFNTLLRSSDDINALNRFVEAALESFDAHPDAPRGWTSLAARLPADAQVELLTALALPEVRSSGTKQAVKRAIDVVGSAALVLVLAPAMLVISIAVRTRDRGPVFFRSIRTGAHGRHFAMFKFRTMVVDPEAMKLELAALSESTGALFKIREDPRITRRSIPSPLFARRTTASFQRATRRDVDRRSPAPPPV
jgi:energy-coupling factor transporter ATP-binding protein EcfA2